MTQSATPAIERRRAPRLRTLLGGIVQFDDNTSTMDCLVRNLSGHGARIVMFEAFRLPAEFDLLIPHHDETHRARVIWRRGDCVGLALSDVEKRDERPRRHMTPRQMRRAHEKEMEAALYA